MLPIDQAMMHVQQIQEALAITEIHQVKAGLVEDVPFATGIKRAWPYFPPSSKAIGDTPCFINTWTLVDNRYTPAGTRGNFSIHMQLLVKDADTDRAAAIASAFYPKIAGAFAVNLKLDGWRPATVLALRGGDPTLTVLDFAGISHIGLDLFLDIHLADGQANEA